MQSQHAAAKRKAVGLLRKTYSAGAVARNLSIPYILAVYWREQAGIPKMPVGFTRPTPEVGETLK